MHGIFGEVVVHPSFHSIMLSVVVAEICSNVIVTFWNRNGLLISVQPLVILFFYLTRLQLPLYRWLDTEYVAQHLLEIHTSTYLQKFPPNLACHFSWNIIIYYYGNLNHSLQCFLLLKVYMPLKAIAANIIAKCRCDSVKWNGLQPSKVLSPVKISCCSCCNGRTCTVINEL